MTPVTRISHVPLPRPGAPAPERHTARLVPARDGRAAITTVSWAAAAPRRRA